MLLKFDALNVASGTKQKQLMAETKGMVLSQLTELQQLKTVSFEDYVYVYIMIKMNIKYNQVNYLHLYIFHKIYSFFKTILNLYVVPHLRGAPNRPILNRVNQFFYFTFIG